MSVCEAPPEQT